MGNNLEDLYPTEYNKKYEIGDKVIFSDHAKKTQLIHSINNNKIYTIVEKDLNTSKEEIYMLDGINSPGFHPIWLTPATEKINTKIIKSLLGVKKDA